jgi:hypothetical protein
MQLRATWPLPAAAILILVGLIYAEGPLSAQTISLALILGGVGLIAWAFAPKRPSPETMTPRP